MNAECAGIGIAEIVGHSDIRLTQNVCQHVYRDAKIDDASKMNALLTSSSDAAKPVKTGIARKRAPRRIDLEVIERNGATRRG
jgi:hypothetical protein